MSRRNRWTIWAWLLVAAALVAGMLACAGCGGSSTEVSTSVGVSSSETVATGSSETAVAASASQQPVTTAATTQTTSTAAAAAVLQVTGPSGTQYYTMDQLKAETAVSGFWGPHKGNLPYVTNRYTGVPVLDLLADVGGLPSGSSLKIDTTDNFPCAYDPVRLAQMTDGTYQVWDKTTGDEGTASVQLIVAYEMDGSPLDSSLGPLRVVPVLAADGYVTEGKYAPYFVVSLEVQ
jgi:hypothetical protein